jgi:flagellar basal-body rod protein FlgB
MPIDPLASRTLQALQRTLGALSARQQVISNNTANVETPGYTALELRFEDALRSALRPPSGPLLWASHPLHLRDTPPSPAAVRPQIVMSNAPARNDGNNVDLEREMAALAETQISFQAIAQLVSKRIEGLRAAISDAR